MNGTRRPWPGLPHLPADDQEWLCAINDGFAQLGWSMIAGVEFPILHTWRDEDGQLHVEVAP